MDGEIAAGWARIDVGVGMQGLFSCLSADQKKTY
jgi:hypothetical protein